MPESPVILLTGASRGLGLAIAEYLLSHGARMLLISRTAAAMEELKTVYGPDRVDYIAADLGISGTATLATRRAVEAYGRLDAVIVNHGVLEPVAKLEYADLAQWSNTFGVNLFSAVELIKEAIPELRKSHGRAIFTSSGAAVTGYQAWGAYGSSKAGLNHLARTLAAEEPEITSLAIRPGTINTQMQEDIRQKYESQMGGAFEKFRYLKRDGKLLDPEQPGHVIARVALQVDQALTGRFLHWDAEELAAYQAEPE